MGRRLPGERDSGEGGAASRTPLRERGRLQPPGQRSPTATPKINTDFTGVPPHPPPRYLVDVAVGAAADALDELEVLLGVTPGQVAHPAAATGAHGAGEGPGRGNRGKGKGERGG